MPLNIVYIGPLSFPLGYASTKRRRYIIDYMNNHNISSHILCTRYKKNVLYNNPINGYYGKADYYDLSDYINNGCLVKYYLYGKKILKSWFDDSSKNILIFHTLLNVEDFPFFQYAKKLGYKILFDQVETSYSKAETNISFKRKLYIEFTEWLSSYAYRKCNGSFVISEALEEQNKRKYPYMPICLLPNSTPILQLIPKKKISNPVKILYAGTYAPKDGVEFLIKAFLLLQKDGVKCKLILTGKGDSKNMKVLDMIKDNPNVEYKGMVTDEELISIMNDCDILTMTRTNSPFANYGFPFKLSEYLSTGNPVIASKVSDVAKILKHKINAYLIEPENVEDIKRGIMFFINNPQTALAIGQNGLDTMKEIFSIDSVGNKFVNFVEDI